MDADPFLQRLERNAILACVAMAAVAFASTGASAAPALAVLAGGGLIAVSYWAIASGVRALTRAADRPSGETVTRRPTMSATIVKVTGRYALLAILAYVMIARLRLHPIGLLAGASSVVVAASVEALRLLLKKS